MTTGHICKMEIDENADIGRVREGKARPFPIDHRSMR